MKTRVIARSDRGSFIGTEPDGDYCVFTLDDTTDIELNDVLSGDFGDVGAKWVKNITRGEEVYICVESWGCSRSAAMHLLQRLGSPTKIFTVRGAI